MAVVQRKFHGKRARNSCGSMARMSGQVPRRLSSSGSEQWIGLRSNINSSFGATQVICDNMC